MEEGEGSFHIAYYCTGHGLGHATRSLVVSQHLVAAGHNVTIITGAPASVFRRELSSARLQLRNAILDTGACQRDAFTVDQRRSLEAYISVAAGSRRSEIIASETAWLRSENVDLVVTDVVPLACAVAREAGLPCIAVSNFSWDFIFSEYLIAAGSGFRRLIMQIADDYASALCLLRLPGHVPMPAFREVIDVPLVVRHAKRSAQEVRKDLGVRENERLAAFIYGGQPPGKDWRLEERCLPPGWRCVVCSAGSPPGNGPLPSNFILAEEDAYIPDLVAAADCVVGKIGYGTTSECLAHSTPLVFLRRDFFNEEPFLRKLLEVNDAAVEMKRRDFLNGNWAPYLERALACKPCYALATNGAQVVAQLLATTAAEFRRGTLDMPASPTTASLQQTPSSSRHHLSSPPSAFTPSSSNGALFSATQGSSRLRDTIAWGFCMARHVARQNSMDVLDWYLGTDTPEAGSPVAGNEGLGIIDDAETLLLHPDAEGSLEKSPFAKIDSASGGGAHADGFCVLEGPEGLGGTFRDTLRFLAMLKSLDVEPTSAVELLPERRAAAGLFLWEEEILVARAPGRLDVMGGIADYSGSTVLQMPIAEAAHVALQLQPLDRQRLWRHQRARVKEAGSRSPALRVVSFNADATNRGPAFDLDVTDLFNAEGEPISYAEAREFFLKDPALSWAAYIGGALIVLMKECHVRPQHGIAMLVSSEVPEGKGVSSSAAVEVAAMTALSRAHGVELDGRRLALLCQMVENLVVGAPCGVMDQMASSLGEAGWLLALRCQPAEVQGNVRIPDYMRFWGVDSGIRHSVGGSDYGAVRTGAFMGLKIASYFDASHSHHHHDAHNVGHSTSKEERIKVSGGGYLSNIPPSLFAARYERRLPDTIQGAEFLSKYGDHLDTVTSVDTEKTYAVKIPAAHPVLENFRVQAFRQALAAVGTLRSQQMEVLGELMLQSHGSYNACGLGSGGTDRLVALVLEEKAAAEAEGKVPGVFGAKITGGGCGGTVCVLGTADANGEAALLRVIQRYAKETAHEPKVFCGTSPGAAHFGVLRVKRRRL